MKGGKPSLFEQKLPNLFYANICINMCGEVVEKSYLTSIEHILNINVYSFRAINIGLTHIFEGMYNNDQ